MKLNFYVNEFRLSKNTYIYTYIYLPTKDAALFEQKLKIWNSFLTVSSVK